MSIDWNEIRKNKYASEPGPSDWPKDVRPISIDGTALIGIDAQGQLHWDGKKLKTETKIALEGWTLFFAAIAAIGAFSSGFVDFVGWLGWKPFQ